MLQHLAADDQLGTVPGGIELLHGSRLEVDLDAGAHGPRARFFQDLRKGVGPAHPDPPAGEPYRQLAFAAADLVGIRRPRPLDQLVESSA